MSWMRFFLKFILLSIAYYFINEPFIDNRVGFYTMVEWWAKLSGYLAQLGLTLVLVTFFSSAIRSIKWGFLGLFLINSIAYLAYYKALGAPLTFSDFSTLFQAKGMIGEAFSGYSDVLLSAILIHIPFVLVYLWCPSKNLKLRGSLITLVFYILILIAYSISLINTQGRGLIGRPGFILPTVQLSVYGYVNLQNSGVNDKLRPKPRPSLDDLTPENNGINTLIMVIDESMNWDLIDLNYAGDVTPALIRYSDNNIINFGKAVSYANCSDLSNASIRKFVRHGEEEKDLLGEEAVFIWDSVKRAGFTPYLIDAQGNGVGHNYFTSQETDQITILPVKGIPDHELIDLIVETRVAEPTEKQFFLVIKQGAHLPYSNTGFEEYFTPAMANSSLSGATREQIINSYKNRARFETNLFFEKVFEKLDYKKDTALIYTSDHGQSFNAPGQKSFHCDTRNPDAEEAVVPLLVIAPEKIRQYNDTIMAIEASPSYKSHYYIPALIMALSGYSDKDVAAFTAYSQLLESSVDPHFVYNRAVPFFDANSEKKVIEKEEIDRLKPQTP